MEEIKQLIKALALFTDALSCHATVMGMTAANMQRQAMGSSMAYHEDSFDPEARRLHELSRELLLMGEQP